jgi:uncharacterized protein YdaT
MPWTPRTFKNRHNKSLSPRKARIAAKVANATLKRTGSDKKAIIAGNVAAKKA